MNLLEQIASHLDYLGFGRLSTNEEAGDIFWGTMPDAPDKAICIYSNDSSLAGSEQGARIQIITRGRTTKEAYELSQSIAEELDDFYGFLCGDMANVSIEAVNTSHGIGYDSQRRDLYSSNYIVRYCDM